MIFLLILSVKQFSSVDCVAAMVGDLHTGHPLMAGHMYALPSTCNLPFALWVIWIGELIWPPSSHACKASERRTPSDNVNDIVWLAFTVHREASDESYGCTIPTAIPLAFV